MPTRDIPTWYEGLATGALYAIAERRQFGLHLIAMVALYLDVAVFDCATRATRPFESISSGTVVRTNPRICNTCRFGNVELKPDDCEIYSTKLAMLRPVPRTSNSAKRVNLLDFPLVNDAD